MYERSFFDIATTQIVIEQTEYTKHSIFDTYKSLRYIIIIKVYIILKQVTQHRNKLSIGFRFHLETSMIMV